MDYSNIKNYIVTTAFCFQKTKVHIQSCNFSTATNALEHIKTDKARAEKWVAEGETIYEMEIQFVKIYPTSENVAVYPLPMEVLLKKVEDEKGGVS